MASPCFKLSRTKSATVLKGYVAEFIDSMDPVSKANGVDLCFAVEKAYWYHLNPIKPNVFWIVKNPGGALSATPWKSIKERLETLCC